MSNVSIEVKLSPCFFSALQEIQNSLTGKVLVAEIRSRNGQDISIVLHDTSSDPDVNLNNVSK